MQIDWQNTIVLVVVVAAGGYLLRTAWQVISRRVQAGCGRCGSCPSGDQEAQTLVEITPTSNGKASTRS